MSTSKNKKGLKKKLEFLLEVLVYKNRRKIDLNLHYLLDGEISFFLIFFLIFIRIYKKPKKYFS